jgi:hypothetical protein
MCSQQRSIKPLALLLSVCVGGLGVATTQAGAPAVEAVAAVSDLDASKNEYLAHARSVTVFDAPGAGTAPGQGTLGIAIHPAGVIAGAYIDDNNVAHAFTRAPSGALDTFDAPGAGTGPGAPGCTATASCPGTVAYGINPAGEIAGQYIDANGVYHGFLRFANGTITTYDVPAAGTGPGQGGYGESINPAGVITGEYSDASSVWHGFVRFRDGAIIVFDAPGAGTGPGQGTFVATVSGITPAGEVTGYYFDGINVAHGYVRAPDGAITAFDPPDAGTGAFEGTYIGSINPKGQVTGGYVDASVVNHGFLRAPDGTITTIDAPGAGTGPGEGTSPSNINPGGEITGNYVDSSGVNHGFLRAPHGSIASFDAPGAGTGSGQGTFPFSNNPAGAITGWEIDANGVFHGFLRNPQGWGSSR